MNKLSRITTLLLIVGLVATTPAWAQVTANWNVATGEVGTASNWDTGLVPTTGDLVYIANGGTATITSTSTFAGDIDSWYLGNGASTSGHITQTGGDVVCTDWFRMGYQTGNDTADPTCVYDMSGGTASIGVLTVVGLTGKAELLMSGTASWTNGNRVYVGDTAGTGTLAMSGNSVMNTPYMSIGRRADNLGIVTLTDNASLSSVIPTNSGSDFYLGTSTGTGSISLTDDATMTLTANSLYMGEGAGASNGSITLSGNAVLTNTNLQTWDNTDPENPVANEDSKTYIGNGEGAVATLTMTGHSTMTSSNDNSDGWSGQFWVGRYYSTGTVDLSGGTGYDEATRGAKLTTTNMADIGSYGKDVEGTIVQGVGYLNVHEYAQFESAGLVMGDGGIGNLLIEGHGQVTVTDSQWMRLGFFSMGVFNGTIKDNGLLTTTGDMRLGDTSGTASLTLESPTTAGDTPTINIGGRFFLGTNGSDDGAVADTSEGMMTMNAGTAVNVAVSMYIGEWDNAEGTLLMNGGALTVGNWLCVGRVGGGIAGATGVLTMNNDASVETGALFAGNSYNGGSGTVVMNDNAQVLSNSYICVAWGGVGELTIGDGTEPGSGDTGAVATATTYVRLGDGNAEADATLNLNVGGTLETSYIDSIQGASAVLNFDGGTLRALGSDIPEDTGAGTPAIMFLSNTGTVTTFTLNVMEGGAIIDTNGFTDTITESLVSGATADGGLTKQGLGELILDNTANTYNGKTVVEAGTLTTKSNAMLSDTAAVEIATGAVLNLDFTGTADTVASLYFNGVAQALGTWGATGSGATFTNDTYFSGTGTILVSNAPTDIPGDANGDKIVNEADATIVASNWGATISGGASVGDFNGDGVINAIDASIMAAQWGDHNEGNGEGTVPEPSTMVLLVLGLVMTIASRRRQ